MTETLRIEPAKGHYVLRAGGAVIGETDRAVWLHEQGHDAQLYLPREDLAMDFLDPSPTASHCPRKGQASYYSVATKSTTIKDVGWSYESPLPGAGAIAGMLSFYDGKVVVERV